MTREGLLALTTTRESSGAHLGPIFGDRHDDDFYGSVSGAFGACGAAVNKEVTSLRAFGAPALDRCF